MRYHGRAVKWIKAQIGWTVRRSLNACRSGASVTTLPRRWVVGRTFAWLGRYRRMSEYRTEASEAFIYAATVRLMLGKAGANVSRNRLMRAFRCPLITFYGSARTYKVSNRDANGLTIIYAKSALAGGAMRRSNNTIF